MPAPLAAPEASVGAPVTPAPGAQPDSPGLVDRIRRVFPYIRHVRHIWAVVFVATVIGAATEPAIPALLKPLLDEGFRKDSFNPWLVPAALLLLFGIRGGAGFIADIALAKIANEGMFTLRQALFARLLDARMDLFGRESASSLSNSIVHEVQNGFNLLVNALTALVKDSLALAALLVYLMFLNWQLTLVVGLMGPAVAWPIMFSP